jgi:hypothetical protein
MEAGYGGRFSIWNLHVWCSNLLALVPCFFPMCLLKYMHSRGVYICCSRLTRHLVMCTGGTCQNCPVDVGERLASTTIRVASSWNTKGHRGFHDETQCLRDASAARCSVQCRISTVGSDIVHIHEPEHNGKKRMHIRSRENQAIELEGKQSALYRTRASLGNACTFLLSLSRDA